MSSPVANIAIIANIFLLSLKKKLVLRVYVLRYFSKEVTSQKGLHLRKVSLLLRLRRAFFYDSWFYESFFMLSLLCILSLSFCDNTVCELDALSTRRFCRSRRKKYSISSKNTCFEVFLDGLCCIGHLRRDFLCLHPGLDICSR